jgi:hypothetical protein
VKLILASLVLAFIATPAMAADAGSLNCIETRLGSESMARIGTRVIAAVDTGEPLDTSLDLDREAVIAARNACRTANKWSNAATETAMSYTKAGASLIGGEAAVKADGLDPVALKAIYAALAIDDRRSASLAPPLTKAALTVITNAAAGAKPADTAARSRVLRHVIAYFASLSGREFYPAEFAAE